MLITPALEGEVNIGKAQDDIYARAFYQEWSRRMGRRAHDPLRRIDHGAQT